MKQKNKVTLVVSQNIPAQVKEGGVTIPAFTNRVEFSSETMQIVNAENVAAFAICALKQYMTVNRLQGATGFKLSKPLAIDFIVNGRNHSANRVKFTMNPERLAKKLETMPELVAAIFTPLPNVGGLTKARALNFVKDAGKTVLADAIKKLEVLDVIDENKETVPVIPEKTEE